MTKKTKKTIAFITVILLAVILGVLIPTWLHPREAVTEAESPLEEAAAGQTSPSPEEPAVLPEIPGTADPINSAAPDTPVSNSTGTVNEPAPGTPAHTSESPTGDGVDGNPGPVNEPAEDDLSNQSWVEAKIAENRHRIADQDLDDFRAIIGKLDMNHINDILERRVAPDVPMEDSLRTYLHSRLNTAEYERAKELFVTYEHLLFE